MHSLYMLFGLSRLEVRPISRKITDLLGTRGTSLDELWQPAGMMVRMSLPSCPQSQLDFCIQSGGFPILVG